MIVDELVELLFTPQIFAPIVYPGLATILIVIILLIWLERKIAGKVQLRYGPLYVFKPLGGILQLIADLIRFLFAEVIVPKRADRVAFILGPILLFTFVYLPSVFFPVTSSYVAIRSDLSLLAVAAVLTIGPLFTILIGWASNNKFSFIGGIREGYLIISYEIPLLISILAMAVLYGSLDIVEIVEKQAGSVWGLVLNPIAAVSFFIISVMSTARFPYEIAEAESEIVMGPYTEYSGILYGLVMGASYTKFYVLSMLFAYLFLGGWYPVVFEEPLLAGLVTLFKAGVVLFLGVFLRSVYPRYRIDQALKIGWHKLFTLSIISLVLSVILTLWGVTP